MRTIKLENNNMLLLSDGIKYIKKQVKISDSKTISLYEKDNNLDNVRMDKGYVNTSSK